MVETHHVSIHAYPFKHYYNFYWSLIGQSCFHTTHSQLKRDQVFIASYEKHL